MSISCPPATTKALQRAELDQYRAAVQRATSDMPPHFPDPSANPATILEARIVELEEINAAQFAELTGWRTQLEAALAQITELEAK